MSINTYLLELIEHDLPMIKDGLLNEQLTAHNIKIEDIEALKSKLYIESWVERNEEHILEQYREYISIDNVPDDFINTLYEDDGE